MDSVMRWPTVQIQSLGHNSLEPLSGTAFGILLYFVLWETFQN
jgi:acid phosphatase family membrane protein YuiD